MPAENVRHIPYRKAPDNPDEPLRIDELKSICKAAGHGHTHKPLVEGMPQMMSPCWFSLEDNSRATYDVRFVQTFNPDFVQYLLDRLERAENAAAVQHALGERERTR